MRAEGVPLWSLETRHPLREFDVIGFSLSYEGTYTNILNMLDLAGLPVRAEERTDAHPLIICGGSGALNPDALADFVDVFVLGDGEETIVDIVDFVREWKRQGRGTRDEMLRAAREDLGHLRPALLRAGVQRRRHDQVRRRRRTRGCPRASRSASCRSCRRR